MSLIDLVQASKTYFPNLKIDYKNNSLFMKLLNKILFFNKQFANQYTTTINSTIYFPSQLFIKMRPTSSAVVILHELVHLHDAKKFSQLLFSFLYLFPQSLLIFIIPLLLISWKIALLFLIFAFPIPSYFRMYFEKRAYITSLYVLNALGNKKNIKPMLEVQKENFINQFNSSYYYYMFPFTNYIRKDFDAALIKIKAGQRPFEDPVFDMLDNLINTI